MRHQHGQHPALRDGGDKEARGRPSGDAHQPRFEHDVAASRSARELTLRAIRTQADLLAFLSTNLQIARDQPILKAPAGFSSQLAAKQRAATSKAFQVVLMLRCLFTSLPWKDRIRHSWGVAFLYWFTT